jgi:hypothetical protein
MAVIKVNPTRELLPTLVPADWDSSKPGPNTGFNRVRFLQSINNLVKRPVINRAASSALDPAIVSNGSVQSGGIGAGPLQPMVYAEFTVKARVTFNVNSVGPAYVYVYRTTGAIPAIPAAGAAPNAGDVVIGGDAFIGGAMTAGVNQSGAFSYLDTGLSVSQKYSYYLAVKAPNGNTLNLLSSSQLLVMERS